MTEEVIKNVLVDSGLTKKEAEVYIFLAKNNPLKGTEIALLMEKDKAQTFRLLKELQAKGFIESTVEFPSRYTVIPFERILNSIIKVKQDEVALIEKSKEELLGLLERKNQVELKPFVDRFSVVRGEKRVGSEIKRIINDTKHQLCLAASIPNLLRDEREGLFDSDLTHSGKSKIQYRFLTEISKQNLNAVKPVIKRMTKVGFNFRARNPAECSNPFPRMIIRDDDEILFFITPKEEKTQRDDICLWTNCKPMVQTFALVFEDLWRNSISLEGRTAEIENKKSTLAKNATHNDNTASNASFREKIPPNKTIGYRIENWKTSEPVTEKGIINKIITAQKQPARLPQVEINRSYGTMAFATIRPPSNFNLPDMHITIFHADKQSSYGEEDGLLILLRLKVPRDPAFIPVAYVGDNPDAQIVWKGFLTGTPAGENVRLVEKDELQVRIHGNTIHAVWTMQIPLLPPQYSLPPASLLIEGYGDGRVDSFTEFSPSGFKTDKQGYGFHAFATFFHPASNYSAQGFDGFFVRDFVATTYPPSTVKKEGQTTAPN